MYLILTDLSKLSLIQRRCNRRKGTHARMKHVHENINATHGIYFLGPHGHDKQNRTQATARHRARAVDSKTREDGSKLVKKGNGKEKGAFPTPWEPVLVPAETKEPEQNTRTRGHLPSNNLEIKK